MGGFHHTSLLVNLHLDVHVHAKDDDVAENVQAADAHQDVGVVEGDLLAGLHHHEDDDQVGAVEIIFCQYGYLFAPGRVSGRTFEDSWWAVVGVAMDGAMRCSRCGLV